ncbi:MAG TPA: nuclear transport factor 2 family protein [Actinomycetota bacterium]|nr:nuclear transport factor 2 family protein [Actinomycetota bacterium]
MAIAFRTAVEAGDLEALVATLAPDVVFHSPVTFRPFQGKDSVAALFAILLATFEDFRYVGRFEGDGGTVLHFRTRVGDREVEGIDMIRTNAEGLIDDFTVMVRPLSAVLALRDSIGARLGARP